MAGKIHNSSEVFPSGTSSRVASKTAESVQGAKTRQHLLTIRPQIDFKVLLLHRAVQQKSDGHDRARRANGGKR